MGFDSPDLAVAAAIAIQRRLAEQRSTQGFAPQVRIGLHASDATQVGGDFHGKGVHEAARIAGLAAAGEIVASVSTVGESHRTSGLRSATLKGLSGPIEIVTVEYYYQDQKVGARTINQDLSFDTGRYASGMRFLEPNDKTNQLLALELTWDLGFAELTSATGTSKFESDGQRDQTDLLMDFDYGYEDFPQFAAYTHETAEEKTFNQELRLVSKGDSRWNWIAGAFYNRFEANSSSAEYTPGIPEWYGLAARHAGPRVPAEGRRDVRREGAVRRARATGSRTAGR